MACVLSASHLRGFLRRPRKRKGRDPRAEDGVSLSLPEGVHWEEWRLLTDKRLKLSVPSDLNRMAFIEGCDAHAILDAIEIAEAEAYERSRSKHNGP